jgi:Cys-rich protein (TIGR01571 family)
MSQFIFLVTVFLHGLHRVRSDECSLIQTQAEAMQVKGSNVEDQSLALQARSADTEQWQAVGEGSTLEVATNGTSSGNGTSGAKSDEAKLYHFLKNPFSFFNNLHVKDLTVKELGDEYWWDVRSLMIMWMTWVIMALLIVLCCFNARPDRLPFSENEDPVETMNRHHFGCFKTPCISFCACFCPMVQWAETMQIASILPVMPAIAIFAVCAALNVLTLTGCVLAGMFTSLLIIYYRQKLRKQFGLKAWTPENCLIDFLYVCCCPCCAIAQEAQAVRYNMTAEPRPAYSSQLPPPAAAPPTSQAYTSTAYTSFRPESYSSTRNLGPVQSGSAGYYPSQTYSTAQPQSGSVSLYTTPDRVGGSGIQSSGLGSGSRVTAPPTNQYLPEGPRPEGPRIISSMPPTSGDRVIPPPSGYSGYYSR